MIFRSWMRWSGGSKIALFLLMSWALVETAVGWMDPIETEDQGADMWPSQMMVSG